MMYVIVSLVLNQKFEKEKTLPLNTSAMTVIINQTVMKKAAL